MKTACSLFVLFAITVSSASGAAYGTVVPVIGGASDLVLDDVRGRLYLTNTSRNQLEVYSIAQRRFLNAIRTDSTPLSAAMSRDGRFLYVTAYDASSLNIIDLNTLALIGRVTLPAKPEGVAVGLDERVLISTIGTGAGNAQNVLLVFDPSNNSVGNVSITPAPPSSPVLPAPSGRPALAVRSQLAASADGRYIVGSNIPNATQRSVFVYETVSATVLRSRRVANISGVLAVAPNGSRFMAGLTLFETSSLTVLAQQNLANAPYPIAPNTNFNTQANQGGSIFSPDSKTLYSAFNIAPTLNPPARANVSQLMISDPDNLMINMGIQLNENLAGEMVMAQDGSAIYALSESGFLIIALNTLRDNPIIEVDQDLVILATDQCGVTAGQNVTRITTSNAGRGRLTASSALLQFPAATAGLGGAGGAGGGAVGGGIIIVIPVIIGAPGGGVTPVIPGGGGQANANISTTAPTVRTVNNPNGTPAFDFTFNAVAARTLGTSSPVHDFLIQSPEAINLAPRVRILQNSRNAEARGEIIPISVGISTGEALEDLVQDPQRQRLYIANSGKNRVEVFDIRTKKLMAPIKVGQLPRSLALTPDGRTLYVANSGGESISVVDLDKGEVTDRIKFPPLPFDAASTLITPSVIATSQRGAMFITSGGQLWSIIGNEAVPRRPSAIIGSNAAGQQNAISAPRAMASTPNGENIIVYGGNGFVYLYDAAVDDFVQSRQVQAQNASGYLGPIVAGPRGQYYVVNGILLNAALTPVAPAPSQPGVTNTAGTNTSTVIPIAAMSPITATQYARFSQPVRLQANTVVTTLPTVDIVDANSGLTVRSVPTLEGPISQVNGANGRTTIGGRTMAVDSTGANAFLLTTSGLSIIPLDLPAVADRPAVNQRGIVNLASLQVTISQNGLVSILGRNLASSAVAAQGRQLPTIMGGVCVTMQSLGAANVTGANAAQQAANATPRALPLLMTSATQINGQIPPEFGTGNFQIVVRGLDKKVATLAQTVSVIRYAPAVFIDDAGQAQITHPDGKPVTKQNPAKRDERLFLFAAGLGLPAGTVRLTSGTPVAASPVAATQKVQVFFGRTDFVQSEVIVDESVLVPGMVGIYRVAVRIPGFHTSGQDLSVTVRIGGVNSPTTGAFVPKVSVD